MISWIVIGILIVMVFYFIRMKHAKHKIFAIVIIVLILFFYTTFSAVLSKSNNDLSTFGGAVKMTKLYFSWLFNGFSNIRNLAGNAIKLDWGGNLTS